MPPNPHRIHLPLFFLPPFSLATRESDSFGVSLASTAFGDPRNLE